MNRRVVGAVVFLFVVVPGLVLAGGVYSELVLSDDSDGPTTGADENLTPPADFPYYFAIEGIEECGTTCRDVTVRLENRGSDPGENVSVTTEVYVEEDVVWEGNETVDRIEAGETYTTTKRVNIDIWDALGIKNNDGYVTIVTLIESPDGTARFAERRKVAKAWANARSQETTQSRVAPQSGHSSSTTVSLASQFGQKSR